jgi:hypothetical protein
LGHLDLGYFSFLANFIFDQKKLAPATGLKEKIDPKIDIFGAPKKLANLNSQFFYAKKS